MLMTHLRYLELQIALLKEALVLQSLILGMMKLSLEKSHDLPGSLI